MNPPSPETTLPCSPWPFLAPPVKPGEIGRLAQYRVLKLLGRGGMGMVFQAEDEQLRRMVALKVMLPEIAAEDQSRGRFLREARTAAALKHDHVVTIYQVGEDRGIPFLAMEFLKGKSLADWLQNDRQPTIAETLIIARQSAKGLAAAHQAGLIHRDIKPANLWLEAPTGRLKILDFGLARWADGEIDQQLSKMTQPGEIVGTPSFMSPEQARGEPVTPQSDVFSLGCVLYRLATGRMPFTGDTLVAVLSAVLTQTPRPVGELNPEAPERLAALIDKLLAKKPTDRPATAQEVVEELVAIQRESKLGGNAGTPAQAETIALGPASDTIAIRAGGVRPTVTRRWLLAGAALGLAAVVAGVVAYASRTHMPDGRASSSALQSTAPEALQAGPPPAPAPQPLPSKSQQPIDLSALIDTQRDAGAGKWKSDGEKLTGWKADGAYWLVLPWQPPTEYRLKLTVTRLGGSNNMTVGLASGENRFNLTIDARHNGKFYTGLSHVDGNRPWEHRSDAREVGVMSLDVPMELTITVRRDSVVLEVGTAEIYRWKGDLGRSKRLPTQTKEPLVLGGLSGGFRFEKITLEPLGNDPGQPTVKTE